MKFNPILPVWLLAAFLIIFLFFAVWILIKGNEKLNIRIFSFALNVSIILLCFIAGMRPMREDYDSDIKLSNLDVLFVVDTTISMWADDYKNGVRMDGVKGDCEFIIDSLPGANFALITFDNGSFIRSPFTQDTETLKGLIDNIGMLSPYSGTGSDMNIPYLDIESLLISSSKKENRNTVLFFLSDGENTIDSILWDYGKLKDYISGGAVMGYGTPEGGRMKQNYGYVIDWDSYGDALSMLDEDMLNDIASSLGIEYVHMTSPLMIEPVLTEIRAGSGTVWENRSGMVTYKDTYFYYVIPLTVLLLLKLLILIYNERRVMR